MAKGQRVSCVAHEVFSRKKGRPDLRRRFIHKPIDGVREPGMAFGAEWVSRGVTIELLCIVMHSS